MSLDIACRDTICALSSAPGHGAIAIVRALSIVDDSRFKRRLIGGKGVFPPEDCGGIWGYRQCLSVLEGKEADTDNLKEWLGDWNPNNFSLQEQKNIFDQ